MKLLMNIVFFEEDGLKKITWQPSEQSDQVLDQLIETLGQMRAELQPPVRQQDPIAGQKHLVIDDPRWALGKTLSDQVLLHVRHPGFGWLTFQLPEESLSLLRNHLSNATQQSKDWPVQ